jgi:hypothetical protein
MALGFLDRLPAPQLENWTGLMGGDIATLTKKAVAIKAGWKGVYGPEVGGG